MKKLTGWLAALLASFALTACAGGDGPVAASDGPLFDDMPPAHETGEPGDLGVLQQPWVSAEFHGSGHDGRPCFSPASSASSGTCLFPASKAVYFTLEETYCDQHIGTVVTQGEYDNIRAGWIEGVQSLHNLGGVTISGISGGHRVRSRCLILSSELAGHWKPEGALTSGKTLTINGPIWGEDETVAWKYAESLVRMHPGNIIDSASRCPAGGTPTEIRNVARWVAVHEMMHALGFAHFNRGLMKASMTIPDVCKAPGQSGAPALQAFAQALSAFDPSAAGLSIPGIQLLHAEEPW